MIRRIIKERLKTAKRHAVRVVRKVVKVPGDRLDPFNRREYNIWIKNKEAKPEYFALSYKPLISVFVSICDMNEYELKKCMESVLNQKYENYEVFLLTYESIENETSKLLRRFEKNSKIRVISAKKDEIAQAKNKALEEAKGEFVALLNNGELAENALFETTRILNENRKLDFIYTDEDKIDKNGIRHDPHFKPDWSPDTILGLNYISYLSVMRSKLIREVGGFRSDFKIEQDYDLYLRVLECTKEIYHIPKVLFHACDDNLRKNRLREEEIGKLRKKVIQDAVKRRGLNAKVKMSRNSFYCYLDYQLKNKPKISIIIPTKDAAKMLDRCLGSIFGKTTYLNYEVIVMSNNSEKEETFELFKSYESKYKNFRVIEANFEFNYPRINNIAVKESKGQYVVLLNNDTEIMTPEWLEIMLGYASQKHIGVVGPQLLYGDNTIQHAGTVMGLGVASHLFVGYKEDEVVWGGRLSVPYDYNAITAACFMVSRKKWDEVGGMEEKLKVAYNDVDFNLKLREKGYYNVFLPMVKVHHYESKTRGADDTPEKKARFDTEQEFMYKKWAKVIERDEFYNPNFSRQAAYRLDKE